MNTDELEIWRTLNECEVVKKVFNQWFLGDRYFDGRLIEIVNHYEAQYMFNSPRIYCFDERVPTRIWVPPLHDPIRPERSLWGMSKKFREESGPGIAVMFMIRDRPDLALAKAIIEQEGK